MNVTVAYNNLMSSTKYFIFCINEYYPLYDISTTKHIIYTCMLLYINIIFNQILLLI